MKGPLNQAGDLARNVSSTSSAVSLAAAFYLLLPGLFGLVPAQKGGTSSKELNK